MAKQSTTVKVALITGGLALASAALVALINSWGSKPKSGSSPGANSATQGDQSQNVVVHDIHDSSININSSPTKILPDETKVDDLARVTRLAFGAEEQGSDDAYEITEDAAREFYSYRLGEAFHFDVFKTKDIDHVKIQDLIITVTKFEELPPSNVAKTSGTSATNLFVVELAKRGTPLPWKFSPKYLLRDSEKKSVVPWSSVNLLIRDDETENFFVKVGSRSRGRFTYSGELVVATRQRESSIQLFSDRTCEFTSDSDEQKK
jgi:hypothetical protein